MNAMNAVNAVNAMNAMNAGFVVYSRVYCVVYCVLYANWYEFNSLSTQWGFLLCEPGTYKALWI
jgi:hypothetical protein